MNFRPYSGLITLQTKLAVASFSVRTSSIVAIKVIHPVLLGCVLLASALAASADEKTKTITLQAGVEDTWISDLHRPEREQLLGNLSFGSARELCIYERGPAGENARALIRFDLSSVKGKIIAAELVLTKSKQSPNGSEFFNQTIAVYPVAEANRDWQAGYRSWNVEGGAAVWNEKANQSTPWVGEAGLSSPGVDFINNAVAEAKTGNETNVPVVFRFTDVTFLNDWATHPERNAGFLLKESNSIKNGGDRFYSSENLIEDEIKSPKLVLTVIEA